MAKIYTKTGDGGQTGLASGERLSKDDLRIEAYGTVDETNSFIGAARSFLSLPDLDRFLKKVQEDLFVIGAFLASRKPPDEPQGKLKNVTGSDAVFLEKAIDAMTETLEPLRHFVLPGGHSGAALLHAARTVCRRAERLVVALARKEPVGSSTIVYLNRLSDFLFVAARYANRLTRTPEVIWEGKG